MQGATRVRMDDSTCIPTATTSQTSSDKLLPQESVISSLYMNDNETLDRVQLNLHSMALIGRRKEYSLLKASYKRIQKGKHPSESVFISGLSGTGKSKLAESIREPVTLKRHGFFVSGKFDQLRNEPYSALVEAFSDLCDLVSQDTKTCQKIARALAGDTSALSKLIPNLSTVTGSDPWDGITSTASSQASFTQLRLACRKFLSAVASREHPVVLFIDDLHWADKESLDIIQSVITDLNSKYVLMIGTYRSDDVCILKGLLETVKKQCLRCTSIQLDNFDCDQVASLIAKCTDKKPCETRGLAGLVVKRTDGNPIFVIRFMEMLAQNELLTHDADMGQWLWSLEQIQEETIACDNVVEIVKTRIQSLSHSVQSVLVLAALSGFNFEKEVIEAVTLNRTSASNQSVASVSAQVEEALKTSEDRGLIESNTDGSFRFCHDSISDCLYSMTSIGTNASVHLLLARVMQKMDDDDKPIYIYSIADQLNRANMLIDAEADCLDCAQCNLRAAKQALRQAAFDMASEYAQHGLAIVDEVKKWDSSNYATVLDLHCVAAEARNCCGDLEESNRHLQQVFRHAESLADMTRARTIHIYALGAHARLEEAIDVAFCGARALGVSLPKKPRMRHALCQLIKTKAMLRGKSDEELLAVPTTKIEGMEEAIHFVGTAAHYASLSMRIPHLILAITTLMQLSVQGKCSRSSSFCTFGILETAMGNIPEAVRMANLTSKMHEIQDGKLNIPSDSCIIHTFLIHWRAPSYDSLEQLQQAYVSAMETGVYDVAFLAVSTWMMLATCCGYNLENLEKYSREYFGQMYEFQHMSQIYLSLPYWQFCLNMLGQSDDPVVLTGEAMDEKTYRADATNAKVLLGPQTLNTVRIILGCHFEYSHLLQVLLAEYESFKKPPGGHFLLYSTSFYVGLSYIKVFRSFGQRSCKRKAHKISNQLKKWTLDGCPNTKPLWALMEAELATLVPRKDNELVGTLFLDAIQYSSALRNPCLEAMANERAARYYQTQALNEELARLYMERAVELYGSYGAFAKVGFLERTSILLKSNGKRTRIPEIVAKECSTRKTAEEREH